MQWIKIKLQALKDDPKLAFPHMGICGYLKLYLINDDKVFREMQNIFRKWKHFSGDNHFPVPYGIGKIHPHVAYTDTAYEDRWDKNHPYGALRWDLVDHIINNIE